MGITHVRRIDQGLNRMTEIVWHAGCTQLRVTSDAALRVQAASEEAHSTIKNDVYIPRLSSPFLQIV